MSVNKAKIIIFLSVAMLIAGAVAVHAASGDRVWVKIYNTSNTKTEQATAIGVKIRALIRQSIGVPFALA